MNPYAPPVAPLRLEPREWPWTGLTWLEFFLAVLVALLLGLSIGTSLIRINA